MEPRYYAIHIPSKGFWDICPNSGSGWTGDINKATLFREDILDKLPFKFRDPSWRFVLVK